MGEVRRIEWSFFLDWQVRAIHSYEDVVSLHAVLKAVLKEDLGKMVSGYVAVRASKIHLSPNSTHHSVLDVKERLKHNAIPFPDGFLV